MGAGSRMDTFLRKNQPLHRLPSDEMLLHDGIHILGLHKAIPDLFGIDDHRRSMFALSQAAGFIDPDTALQACSIRLFLQKPMQFSFSVHRTRGTGTARFAVVGTNEDVVFQIRQEGEAPFIRS